MKQSKTDLTMVILLGISSLAVLAGALLKLEHVLYGDIIFKGGFVASFFFSGIEIWRLRRVVKKLKSMDNNRKQN